ncbi:MAG TPA: FadR/GntR family transcriptional regulator [Gemmatimonadaceae bacterium]|nr:FadR/GntR family transcriptional regulator [Gemmatimonadaceae bacterium]
MMKPPPRPLARRRLVDGVIEHLQEEISLGRLAPGDRLPTEGELTASFGVSRTTVREAVAALAHAGLLDVRQGDGTYVRAHPGVAESLDRRLQRAAILHVYEVRRPLEMEAARLAAERRSDADAAVLRRLLEERDAARARGDTPRAVELDVEFHTGIALASQNPVLADLYRAFAANLRDALSQIARDPLISSIDTTKLHHDLLRAIEKRDPAAAGRIAQRLLDADADVLQAALAPRRGARDAGRGTRDAGRGARDARGTREAGSGRRRGPGARG